MSKVQLPRRTFLKGVGATLALPMLEAMLPAPALAAAAGGTPAPLRMAFVFFPNGAVIPDWRPKDEGSHYTLPPTLEPLSRFKNDFCVLSELAQQNARALGDGGGDHARSAATFLTGVHPVKTGGADIRAGISADQLAAEKVGKLTRLPSLELGTEKGRMAGQCDSGYSCAYSNAISWKSATTPMAKEINPKLVFERMFGNSEDRKNAERRAFYRKSILDMVRDDAAKLQAKLGQTDRRKVDEYFTSVREIEQRIERSLDANHVPVPDIEIPDGLPKDLTEHVRLMYDLLVLAFQTDTTRVATFMLANEGSNRSYPMVGVNDGHHHLSHHQGKQDWIDQIKKIDTYFVTQFAYFLDKLKSVKEGEGTLLDNSMIVYGSAISDGNRHNHNELPILLAGRGRGTIRPGRHIVYPKDTPLNNLFLSMLDRLETPVKELGDSTGRLPKLDG